MSSIVDQRQAIRPRLVFAAIAAACASCRGCESDVSQVGAASPDVESAGAEPDGGVFPMADVNGADIAASSDVSPVLLTQYFSLTLCCPET